MQLVGDIFEEYGIILMEFDTEHPGLMADNCTRNIGGSNFYFAAGGAMQTGWVLRPEGWYYADGSGAQSYRLEIRFAECMVLPGRR